MIDQVHTSRDIDLLLDHLIPLPDPVAKSFLILLSGLPGTGKSYFSRMLSERMEILVLESDHLRRVLFPVPDYSSMENSRLFQACHLLIEDLLDKHVPVLFDATNLVERKREHLYSITDRLKAKLIIVRVSAPEEEVQRRLQLRTEGADKDGNSDADWEVYSRMRTSMEPIRRNHFVVDTSRDVTPVLDKVVGEVNKRMAA